MVSIRKIKSWNKEIGLKIVWFLVLLFLVITILLPLVLIFTTPKAEDFIFALKSDVIRTACRNTFVECICSTSTSVLIGFIYAYAVVKGDIPCRKFFAVVPLIHLMTPPFVGGLSFILLLGRNGFITKTLLGLDISLYGFWGLLVAQSLCFFPIAYMILSQTLSGINPSLELCSYSFGAGRIKTFFSVTLPLAMPGIISSVLFIAVSVMSDFGNPMIVAGRYKVLAVEIYTQLTGWVSAERSAVLGIILVIPSLALFVLQNVLSQKNMNKTATIGGKLMRMENCKTSIITKILLTLFCSFISICVITQILAIVAGSFQELWGIKTSFTLTHIKNVWRYTRELKNSILFAFTGAMLSCAVAMVASYLVARTAQPLRKSINILSLLPSSIPGSLFGLAFSQASVRFGIHNSALMIVIAISVGFMPFSYRIITSSYMQIKTNLDDGARALGAGRLKVLTSVLLPLSSGSVFSAFLYDFVRGVGTMSAVIFLVSFDTPLASIKILNLAEEGFWGDAAALALVLTCVTFMLLLLGSFLLKAGEKNGRK